MLKDITPGELAAQLLVCAFKAGQWIVRTVLWLARASAALYQHHIKTMTWGQIDKVAASCLAMAAVAYLIFASNVGRTPSVLEEPVHVVAAVEAPEVPVETTDASFVSGDTAEQEPAAETAAAEETVITEDESAPVTEMVAVEDTAVLPETTAYTDGVYAQIAAIHTKYGAMLAEEARLAPKAKTIKVDSGDTLTGLLVNKAGVGMNEAYQAVQALKKLYNPRALTAGHEVTVLFKYDEAAAENKFTGLKIDEDMVHSVAVKADVHGEYKATQIVKQVDREFKGFSGKITDSLYLSAKRSGMPDHVIVELIRMFSWSVDFQREIRAGDTFEILYEEYKTEDGKIVTSKGDILYAKLTARGTEMPFYRFKDSSGFVDYYNNEGRSAKKTLMRTPIDGARLTSGFGNRKHPVLGYNKMHKGVDFAGPVGTPVYASGDGVIEKMQRWSSYGNYVKIKHRSGLKTAYAHLNGFKRGLKAGTRVKQGDVIGYLGSTGRVTGPHLHYEVLLEGKQVNPLSLNLPAGSKLKGKDLDLFQRSRATAMANFKNALSKTELAENTATRKTSDTVKN